MILARTRDILEQVQFILELPMTRQPSDNRCAQFGNLCVFEERLLMDKADRSSRQLVNPLDETEIQVCNRGTRTRISAPTPQQTRGAFGYSGLRHKQSGRLRKSF